MNSLLRPRRSALYLPGGNQRALEKARQLPADIVILDLEDAVAPEAKAATRQAIADALPTGFGRREAVVRVNALHTPWGRDDVQHIAPLRPDALLLPKVESAEQIHELAALMRACQPHDRAQALPPTRIWAMIETPLGVLRAEAIASADPLLACLVMGTSDLIKDLRARHTPDRLAAQYALSRTILAARAHGLAVLDGVHLDLNDEAGLLAACAQGRDLGFDGKTVIHPKQIAAANAAFGPTEPEIDFARRAVAAFETAAAQGKGVATLDGQLIENLHAQEARRLIALAEAIGAGSS